jgi:hypothetical protein
MKRRLGEWYYTYAAITTFNRKFLVRPARCRGRLSLLGNLDPGRPAILLA